MAAEYNVEREMEKLVSHFGGKKNGARFRAEAFSLSLVRQSLPQDALNALSSSYEGVLASYGMMKGEEPSISRLPEGKSPSQNEMDLQSMMRDPKYWRDQDPSFVRKSDRRVSEIIRQEIKVMSLPHRREIFWRC